MEREVAAVSSQNLVFRYGRRSIPILNGVSIHVQEGKIYGLLGPSGCGKTTLLHCMVGQHRPSSGSMLVFGEKPGSYQSQPHSIGFMPQEIALYQDMTTEETLTYFGRIQQMSAQDIAERISFLVDFLDLPDKTQLIRYLSGGQRRRASFAAALVHNPRLLILDEPTVGVDPLLRQRIWDHLGTLAECHNKTIVITTHYIEEAKQAHRVGLMRNGRLLTQANPMALIDHQGVSTLEEAFLNVCRIDSQPRTERTLEIATLRESYKRLDDLSGLQEVLHNSYNRKVHFERNDHEDFKLFAVATASPSQSAKGGASSGTRRNMTLSHLGALVSKDLTHFKRNLPLMFCHIIFPTITVVLCSLSMGGGPHNLAVAVANEDANGAKLGEKFLDAVDGYYIKQKPYSNLSSALAAAKKGQAWAVVYINPHFSNSFVERFMEGPLATNTVVRNGTIKLYIDFTNHQIAMTVYEKLNRAFQTFAESMLVDLDMDPQLAAAPIQMGEPLFSSLNSSQSQFIAPAIMIPMTIFNAVGISSILLIIDRKYGMLNRTLVAGVRTWEVVASLFSVLLLLQVAQSSLMIASIYLFVDMVSAASVVWVTVAVFLTAVLGLSFGLLVSAVTENENTASLLILGLFFPTVLLSGVMWTVEALPNYFQYVSKCLPFSLLCDSVRSVVLRGWSISENGTWEGYLSTVAWIVAVLALSSLLLKLKK